MKRGFVVCTGICSYMNLGLFLGQLPWKQVPDLCMIQWSCAGFGWN